MAYRVNSGDTWTGVLANASLNPVLDGQTDQPGHGEKVPDNWLSDDQEQIKKRFYNWYENLQATIESGLTLNINAGIVVLDTGDLREFSPTQVILEPETVTYVAVNTTGEIRQYTELPAVCVPICKVQTNTSSVTSLEDVRPPMAYQMNTYKVALNSTFKPGDVKYTCRSNIDPGWLECFPYNDDLAPNDGTFYDPVLYPDLFDAIGYTFGQSGNLFRLPRGDLYLTANQGALGDVVGASQKVLETNNIPKHSHPVNDTGHSHSTIDPGHNHGAINASHSHQITQYPHVHGVNDPGHHHPLLVESWPEQVDGENDGLLKPWCAVTGEDKGVEVYTFVNGSGQSLIRKERSNLSIAGASAAIAVQRANIQGSTQLKRANIQIQKVGSNVTLGETGNNQPFDNRPGSLVVKMWIKT